MAIVQTVVRGETRGMGTILSRRTESNHVWLLFQYGRTLLDYYGSWTILYFVYLPPWYLPEFWRWGVERSTAVCMGC